jgi:23S rRNA G2445 N2-methylase RlmL
MCEFFATYGRGCLDFVKNELIILEKHFNTKIEILNDKLEGKILFKTNLIIEKLIYLKTIERLFLSKLFLMTNQQKVNLLIENELDFGQDLKDQLEKCNIIVESCSPNEPESKRTTQSIKYRINVKLTGIWRKNDKLRSNLIDTISNKINCYNYFEVDLKEPNFEIICHLSEISLAIGIPVTKNPLSVRNYIKNDGLRSTICSNMVQTALFDEIMQTCIDEENITFILDPFCGKGCLINEWFSTIFKNNQQFFMGSDASLEQIDNSIENLNFLNTKSKYCDLILTNLHERSIFPYRDNSIDLIISDLPFGSQHLRQYFTQSDNFNEIAEIFYLKLLKEFKRILIKKNAILILLINSNEVNIFENKCKLELDNFEIKLRKFLSLGKTCAHLYKLVC